MDEVGDHIKFTNLSVTRAYYMYKFYLVVRAIKSETQLLNVGVPNL